MEAIEVIRHENIAFRAILKRTTLLFLPFAIIAGIIAFSMYKKELKFSSFSRESAEAGIVNLQREAVLNEFDHVVNNLLLLSREFELHMTRSGASDPMELFGREFLIFSDNMRAYDQIRLLDETGMELIRVNLNGGAPYLVPKDELQFKGGRYYFNKAFQLGRSEIYVSPFDLNMEEGKIEQPLKPMIRLATPVFYKDGRKRGIVIVNYLGGNILNSLKELAGKSSSRFMLINSDGFWLVGPTPDDEWGFMFEDRSERKFDNAYPEAWQEISETGSGLFYNEDGMFTYNTVYPSIEAIRASPGIKDVSEAAKIRIDSEANYWKIVSYIPEDLLNAARYSLLWRFLLVYGLFAGLWAMVSWQLARISLHRKIAQERLEKSEASLTQAQHIAHLGNWEWDLRSDETDWSGELFNILHLDSQKSHPGFRAFLKAVHPEDRAFVKKSFAEALAKKKPVSIDHRIVLPDSSERVVVHDQGEVVFDESGEPIKVVGTIQDVTLPKKAEEMLRKNNELLDSIRHAQDRFLVEGNTQPLFDELLNDLLVLTESKYGFIGEVLYNSEGEPYLKTHAITDISWNDETRKFYEEKAPEGMEFCNLNSLFGAVMVTGEFVISNDPATDPRRSGLPEGHPSLDAFLGVPFRLGSKLVGMVGIANRPGGYDAELVEFLEPFILTCGNIIDALRNNRQRQDAEQALKQSESRFRSIFENSGDAIFVIDPAHDRIIEASPSACSMLGYTREELLSTPMSAIHPNEIEKRSQFAKTVFEEGKGWTDELSCRTKSGEFVPAEITASSFHTDEGECMLAIVRDITSRKLMEQELLLFRNLMDQTKDGIFINDAETGRILDVNESACLDMGYTREELIGKRVIDFATTLPDDFSWEAHAKELHEKGSMLLESGHRRKDGSTFPVEVSLREVEFGGKRYNMAVVRDITERKRTEEELRKAHDELEKRVEERTAELAIANKNLQDRETLYRHLVESAKAIPWKLDLDTFCFTYVGPQSVELLGYPEEAWYGNNFWVDHLHPDDREFAVRFCKKKMEAGEYHEFEYRMMANDGRVVWIRDNVNVATDEKGKVFLQGYMYDITVRKKAEEALLESERYNRMLFEKSPIGLALCRMNGELVDINPAYASIIGRTIEGTLGLTYWDITPKRYAEDEKRQLESLEKRGMYGPYEKEYIHKDAHFVPVLLEGITLEQGGETFIWSSVEDITERKKFEEQIKASLHEKEILLREVHHRVKNNMQVISSLLRMQAEKIKDEGYADMLKESQERIRSMSLIHETLYQSKDFANVDFKKYVETLVNSLFRSHGINVNKVKINMVIEDIKLDLENAIPCGLIINELVSNSLKYAFPAGREGEVAIVIHSTDGDELELVVADNGVGMPEGMDVRGSETLGLYIVTMLAERQLEGEVEFSRESGTKCRISFKRQEYKPRI